jgi:ABC-type multidrug transport system fused ATPase/permease subunit
MSIINFNKIIWHGFMKNKSMISIIILSLIAYVFMQIVFPMKCAKFMDNIPSNTKELVKILVITLSPLIIAEILYYITDRMYANTINNFDISMINKTFEEVLENIKQNPKNDLDKITLVRNMLKVLEIKEIIDITRHNIIPTLIISFGLFFYFYRIDKTLAYCTLFISFFMMIVILFMGKVCLNKSKIRDDKFNEYILELNDIVENIDIVTNADTIKEEINRLNNIKDHVGKYNIDNEMYSAKIKSFVGIMSLVALFVLGGILLKYFMAGKITKGDTIAYLYIILSLIQYYDNLSSHINHLFNYFGNYKKAKEYFETFLKEKDNPNKINITDGIIEFKNISLKIGDKQIYNNFSALIPKKFIVGIVGEIGSGKSTLLKLLLGYYEYDGIILIDGQNIKDYSKNEIRKYLAYIPQVPKFFNRTIFENLKYGTNKTEQEINEIIKNLDLNNFIDKFPQKLDTIIVNNGENLSGGQKQILYLIKMIILNKKIILMDEPTSSLDGEYTKIFIGTIRKITDKTILIVTHDNSINEIFNKVITIKKI